MGYNNLLDTWFSSFWYTGLLILLMLAVGMYFHRFFLTERKYKFGLGVLYMAVFMLILFSYLYINPKYWGYGNGVEVADLRADKNNVAVMDYVLEAGDETNDPTPHYRVQLLDMKTGEKKCRALIGQNTTLYYLDADEVLLHRYPDELIFADVNTGAIKALFSKETLPEIFPEMKTGIDQFHPNYFETGLVVTCKDGKTYYVDYRTRQIAPKPERNTTQPAEGTYRCSGDVLSRITGGTEMQCMRLSGSSYGDKLRKLKTVRDSVINTQLEFLDGEFAAAADSVIIILHFETTEHKHFRLTALTADGKKQLWQMRQEEMQFEDRDIYTHNRLPKLQFAQTTDAPGVVVFSYNKEVLKIETKTAKVLWRTKI